MTQLAGDLMTAIMRLPKDHYVTFRKEQNEDGRWFLTARVLQEAPKDGWPSRGPQWKHDDRVIFGVSADPERPEVLERLLIAVIAKEWP